MNINNLIEDAMQKYKDELEKLGHVNIIIAGKTGVGKSTLINAVFRERLAETGFGRPVTSCMKLIQKDGVPVSIYDTVGFELDEDKKEKSIKEITETIDEKIEGRNPAEFIHCLWYCVDSGSDRFEEAEADFVNQMAKKIPVIIVITKAYLKGQAKKFRSAIDDANTDAKNICVVLAEPATDEDLFIHAYGVENLIDLTCSLLPESAKQAWANVTNSLKLKNSAAMAIVKQTMAASFTTGCSPIPMSDAPLLVAAEVSMLMRISAVYGVDLTKNIIKGIASGLLGVGAVTLAGRTIVSNLLKCIPGVGTVVGGAISGTVASALTLALGKSYIEIMNGIVQGEIDENTLGTEEMQQKMKDIMKEKMQEG